MLLREGLLFAAYDSTAPAAWTLGHIFLTLGYMFSDTMIVCDVCCCFFFFFVSARSSGKALYNLNILLLLLLLLFCTIISIIF